MQQNKLEDLRNKMNTISNKPINQNKVKNFFFEALNNLQEP